MSDRAVLVPADPRWRRQADDLLAQLRERAGDAVRHGDHIGSTAVAGLAAKPVLDLQLAVPDLTTVDAALTGPLESLGFEPRPITRDHVPAAWSSPPTEWSKRLWVRRGGPEPDVNLHVRRCGAANERLALLFRDWFRAHPEAVPAYAAFKTVLAASVADRIVYSEVKDPVVDLVIGVAEPWAVRTGWAPHPPDPLDRPDPERPPRGAGLEGVDLSGATLTGVRLVGARLREVDLSGARLREVDLSGARLREVDLSRVQVRNALLRDVDLSGELLSLQVNGVDVAPLVEAELDRLHPERTRLRPGDAAGFRAAWTVVEDLWAGTVDRARRLDPDLLHTRVDDEWSFVETLRHLVFATDAWVRRVLLEDPSPWHPLDLPFDELPDTPGVPRDRDARPSLEEVLALRADRMATVRCVVDELTDDRLAGSTDPVTAPGWPAPESYPVRDALRVVLDEEWWHRQYAERDLDVLTGRGPARPARDDAVA